jgi:tRNA A-37 threonylcarbamoyl transferase component Bud32
MLTPGGTLGGRYRLDERIATGGMGDVWKGEDTVLGRTVAVKILQSALLDEPGFIERFRGEARVMATIDHPGVVRVYDYGESTITGGGTVAYLVMEFVEGEALSRTLSRVGRLTPARTMNLIAQAGDALQAAHDKGIVHRDVKPGNLLVRPDGKLVLTDFGIARTAAGSQLTQAGSILGTASYVSPEQASGATVTPASDVYSLGVVAYQCVAGRRPFEGDNPVAVAMSHIREQPPPLPADIQGPIRTVIERSMAKDPGQRWPSAAAFAGAARQAAQGAPVTGALPTSGAGAGTAVMPAFAPVSGSPTSGSPTGSYARGAAGIPSSAPPVDSTYAGYGAGPYQTQVGPAPKKRSGPLVAAIVIAVILVLGGGTAIGIALLSGNDNGNNPSATGTPTPTATKTTSGNQNTGTVDLRALIGEQYSDAAQKLTDNGVNVSRVVRFHKDVVPGAVWNYRSPNGESQAKSGDDVVLFVQPTDVNGGNDGNGNGNGNNNGNNGNPLPTMPSTKKSPSTSSSPEASASSSGQAQRDSVYGVPR